MSDALQEHLEDFQTWLQDAGFEPEPNAKRIWNGSVSIEWTDPTTGDSSVSEHRLSIILPPGFPYHAPMVVSRDDPPLAPSWHLAPGSPHTLCLWDSQIGWRPSFTAQFLLGRIEDWFYNYHTDSWPADSEVPDLHQYLEEKEGLVVIGDEWTPPSDEKNGRFTFWRYQRFHETLPCLASCYEDGHVQLQIRETEKRLVENLLLVADDIKRSPGVWFRLAKPFVPPNNLRDLLSHIDADLGMEKGWASRACIHAFGYKLSDNGFPIALGYTDNQSQERWLFLWAQLLSTKGRGRQRISWSRLESLSQIKLKSFRTAPAGKEDLLRRSAYLSKRLSSCKTVVFGVGALGSSVAMLLAKAGVGEVRLVDNDILMPGNVMRHVCGLKWVGFKKTIAVERLIRTHNPDCHVHCCDSTWEPENLGNYIEGCDVVVDTTANYNFSLYLNEICIASKQPIVFAAAYRRAAIGRVIVRRSSSDPCLACYVDAETFWSEDEYPVIPADPDGTFIEDGCGVVTEEAVALDVEAVANLTTRIAIKAMQGQLGSKNLAILVSEPLADVTGILAQEGLHWKANKPLTHCSICCRDKMLVYYKVAEKALEFIFTESLHKYPNETGGILVGKFDGDCVLIEHATGPGPAARHSPQLFKRNGDYSQRVLDDIVMEHGGRYDYIGEWHSHPVNSGPSAKDVSAMRWVANNRKYAIDQPIIGLCTNESVDTWQLSFYLFDGQQLRELKSYLDFRGFTRIGTGSVQWDL